MSVVAGSGKTCIAYDQGGLIFAAGIQSKFLRLYDLKTYENVGWSDDSDERKSYSTTTKNYRARSCHSILLMKRHGRRQSGHPSKSPMTENTFLLPQREKFSTLSMPLKGTLNIGFKGT